MRTFGFVRGLARHAEVTLACFGAGPPLPLEGVRVLSVGAKPGSRRVVGRDLPHIALANLRAPDPRMPLQVRLSLDGRMRRLVRREMEDDHPHVVHAMPSTMAPHLPPKGTCHRHLDLNDSLALSMATQARAAVPPARPFMRAEARLLYRYEALAAASADSVSLAADWDRRNAPGLARAGLLAPGVDIDTYRYQPPDARPPSIVFFGNLGYLPNVQAADFVAREILPRVRQAVPDARLRLVGADAGRRVRQLAVIDGAELVGRVTHMTHELHRAAVAILPSLSGAGIKTKVQEAFSAGTPVVSNRLGVEGVQGAVAGRHYLCGETSDDLAEACVKLLRDARHRVELAREARRLIEGFTWEAQVEKLLLLYGPVAARTQ